MDYITQQIMQRDVVLTWDQINATIDAILSDEKLGRRRLKLPTERRNRSEGSKVTVEILPHGARRIKMNWDFEDGHTRARIDLHARTRARV